MERKMRWIYILTFIFSAAGVAFISASMGTEYWIQSYPTRDVDNKTEDGAKNVTDGNPGSKFKGYIHFGLFHGFKTLDWGLGPRKLEIWISEEYVRGMFNFGLWVSTVVFEALAIAFGLTAMGFSALNASTKPIETITGPIGLYLWNGIAILLSLIALILYLALFFVDLRENILSEEDQKARWTSEDRTSIGYSFYFIIIGIVMYGASILTVALSGVRIRPIRYGNTINGKAMDGVMMY